MDFPLRYRLSKSSSATFPVTYDSAAARSQRVSGPLPQPGSDEPFAADETTGTDNKTRGSDESPMRPPGDALDAIARHRSPRQLLSEPLGLDGAKSHQHHHHRHRHKHSKSRELRLPRPMSHLAASAGARGLLPAWSGGKDRDQEGDDGLLRLRTNETSRTRWGSDSTSGLGTGSRKGSLLDIPDQQGGLGPIRRQEIRSAQDLEQVKKRRKQGEEYLRSALSSIGTVATDVTRRLDYTYYNLLEKITALNATIASFQELSDSASTLLGDFERETAGLDQDIRRQINDLKGFEPQLNKADVLEVRMRAGRQRVEALGKRLETFRHEIDGWEQRETEWQTRTSRRLRIFWAVITGCVVVLALALVLQNWPLRSPVGDSSLPQWTAYRDQVGTVLPPGQCDALQELPCVPSRYPSSLAVRRESLARSYTSSPASVTPTEHDPWRVLDEL